MAWRFFQATTKRYPADGTAKAQNAEQRDFPGGLTRAAGESAGAAARGAGWTVQHSYQSAMANLLRLVGRKRG